MKFPRALFIVGVSFGGILAGPERFTITIGEKRFPFGNAGGATMELPHLFVKENEEVTVEPEEGLFLFCLVNCHSRQNQPADFPHSDFPGQP